jgi:hypothetical protein
MSVASGLRSKSARSRLIVNLRSRISLTVLVIPGFSSISAISARPIVNAAKPLLYLMRTDFGVRANTPAMIIGVTCLFACYHELANLLGHWGDPPFFQSFAWPFILICEAAGCIQMVLSWWLWRLVHEVCSWPVTHVHTRNTSAASRHHQLE